MIGKFALGSHPSLFRDYNRQFVIRRHRHCQRFAPVKYVFRHWKTHDDCSRRFTLRIKPRLWQQERDGVLLEGGECLKVSLGIYCRARVVGEFVFTCIQCCLDGMYPRRFAGIIVNCDVNRNHLHVLTRHGDGRHVIYRSRRKRMCPVRQRINADDHQYHHYADCENSSRRKIFPRSAILLANIKFALFTRRTRLRIRLQFILLDLALRLGLRRLTSD